MALKPTVLIVAASSAISCENLVEAICTAATTTAMRAAVTTLPLRTVNIAPSTNAASRIVKTADGLALNIAHTTNKLIKQGVAAPCYCAIIPRMKRIFWLCWNYTWSTFPIVSAASLCAAVVTWA